MIHGIALVWLLMAGAGSTATGPEAPRCRYTVRDVGFVDLGDPGYRLLIPDHAEDAEQLARLGRVLFLDGNVDLERIPEEGHPDAWRFRKTNQPLLVSPTGTTLPLSSKEGVDKTALLGSVLKSESRRALTRACLDQLCSVLLVHGSDDAANRRANEACRKAIEEIEDVFDLMPKDVGKPPEILIVEAGNGARERTLLWSLDVPLGDRSQPSVAILFGRVRRMGTTLHGDAITQSAVRARMDWIGQSCECELDRTQMRGHRTPLEWGGTEQALAAQRLGFDPEDPLVKAEITAILARGPGGGHGDQEGESIEDLLMGYEEIEIPGPGDTRRETRSEGSPEPTTASAEPRTESTSSPTPGDPWKPMWYAFSAFAGLVVVAGAVLILRARS